MQQELFNFNDDSFNARDGAIWRLRFRKLIWQRRWILKSVNDNDRGAPNSIISKKPKKFSKIANDISLKC